MQLFDNINKDKLYLWSIMLMAVALPWPMAFGNYSLGLLGLVWFLTGNYQLKWVRLKNNNLLLLFASSVFLLTVYGLLYTSNMKVGLFLLEKRLAILLLPIIVLSSNPLGKEKVSQVAMCFVWSCFVAMTFCIIRAFSRFMELYTHGYANHNIFTTDLISVLEISHVYFGLYLVIAFVVITTWFFDRKRKFGTTVLYILSTIYIFLFLVLITAKMALITAIMLFGLFIFMTQRSSQALKYLVVLGLGLGITIISLMSINFNVFNRLKEMIRISEVTIDNNERDYASTRLGPWKCSLNLIKQYGILGVGTGDVQDGMDNWYRTHGLSDLIEYESHNQYMNVVLGYGLLGIVFFIWATLGLFRLSISEHYMLYLLFLLAIYLGCLTENVFDLNKGILLFSFFNSLFLSSSQSIHQSA